MAVMAASHAGEDRHVRLVQAALRTGGLTRDVLQCGVHPPFDGETAQRLARDGEPLNELRHNCSGKHAAMALHAKAAGWEVETYWEPDHPCQVLAREVVAAVSGVPVRQVGTATDGCGVVSFAIPLTAAARAYAHLADPRIAQRHQGRGTGPHRGAHPHPRRDARVPRADLRGAASVRH